MNLNLVNEVTQTQLRHDIPSFKTGDTLRVSVKIREGNKERIQVFEGLCIGFRGSGVSKTFIVRKISFGVGVERNFLVNSPTIASIQVVKSGKVRRKKIFYIRNLSGKSARLKETLNNK